ncbi:MAG: hypothetical protein IIC62_05740 [Proteobacteria bacterium]|nr:hypothetical protein [Pseudomonadota bacterium]
MKAINRKILEQVIAASVEPLMIVRVDHTDWPVVLTNPAFDAISGHDRLQQPFADVIEALVGREMALEVSNSMRSQQESSFAVEVGSREYLLGLKPLHLPTEDTASFCVVFWRDGAGSDAGSEHDRRPPPRPRPRVGLQPKRVRLLGRDGPRVGGKLRRRRSVRQA